MPGERQPEALHRIGNEADRLIRWRRRERLKDRFEIVPAEIGHQTCKIVVRMIADNRQCVRMTCQICFKLLAPGRPALEHQGRVELVGTIVDPSPQRITAGPREGTLQQLAVLDENDLPAKVLEQAGDLHEQAVGHHRVEALPVVIDHPPGVGQPVLPVFEQRLVNVAFVDLGVAHQGDHPTLGPFGFPALGMHVILHQTGKPSHRNAKTNGARREVDVVFVLGARRIALRATEGSEILQLIE